MSNKKQQSYINKATEPGVAPPRYQPPPQVSSGPGILKHYPASSQSHPLPFVSAPVLKDGKSYSVQVPNVDGVKPFQPEIGKYYPPPPPPPVANGDSNKLVYPGPPQYPAPPSVIQPPAQRRPNPTVGLPQRLGDDELLRLGSVEMLKFVRKAESDTARVSSEQGQAAREAARRMQSYVSEIRMLKEANQRLGDDNQELRDLCCFLDDDRQKGRKLAREWQRFGRYTASVMRQEVSAYQNKLRELDNKQQELIKDNLELKELCLYLDEERNQSAVCPSCGSGLRPGTRDDGDGSSSSTNADEPPLPAQFAAANPRRTESRERLLEESIQRQRTVFNDQVMHYVRSLEQRVKQLEEEKLALQQKLGQVPGPNSSSGNWENDSCGGSRPEAVVQALQVLEVREQLERGPGVHDSCSGGLESLGATGPDLDMVAADLDAGEKALVREMCNVVWRKLEEGPAQRR
ncbi:Coiled-coil domain-containing protein 85C [Cryptotermes secundus]|uniref:Coiled-coil domain-containing protein 85C n=1 Tax=Cryptotermes secundus TaxID=105785 RepID=A0A2J7PU08_9NEOP|nr:coiled-coil domain-containing protein 85C [Cryptotermes secundus]PNF19817.1 Coiled-coil domain-containing protein 85C [Cryptotermes secundus]